MQLISVIVPIYNTEKYLSKCLDSILAQTYTDWEAILVDDGSSDNCGEICDEYAKKDCRFKVLHKKNEGVSIARNCGIENASGEWIVFVDSDDFVTPDYIDSLFRTTNNGKMPFGMTGMAKVSKTGEIVEKNRTATKYTLKRNECIELLFDYSNGYWGYICGKIYNKNLLSKYNIRFREGIHFNEDRLFCFEYLSFLKKNEKIVIDTKAYYNYVIHENAVTSQEISNKNLTELDAFIVMDKIAKKRIGKSRLSLIIRSKCLDSLELLYSQYWKSGVDDERIAKKLHNTYKYCVTILDLLPPYYGCFSKRLIKALFKRI